MSFSRVKHKLFTEIALWWDVFIVDVNISFIFQYDLHDKIYINTRYKVKNKISSSYTKIV